MLTESGKRKNVGVFQWVLVDAGPFAEIEGFLLPFALRMQSANSFYIWIAGVNTVTSRLFQELLFKCSLIDLKIHSNEKHQIEGASFKLFVWPLGNCYKLERKEAKHRCHKKREKFEACFWPNKISGYSYLQWNQRERKFGKLLPLWEK